jgi:hypothetical protein
MYFDKGFIAGAVNNYTEILTAFFGLYSRRIDVPIANGMIFDFFRGFLPVFI